MARDIQFDAQCDLAKLLVDDEPNEADLLLREFVHDLTDNGYRVVGLIQTRLGEGGTAVTVLPTGETIALASRQGAVAGAAARPPCDLAEASARIDRLIEFRRRSP